MGTVPALMLSELRGEYETHMDLNDLKRSYEATLRNFRGVRQKLEAALAPHGPAPGTVERILGCAEEFSLEATLRRLGATSEQFGVRLPAEAQRAIAPLLHSLIDDNGRLDQLIAQREAKLRQADPKRLPVYPSQGREFEVDAKRGTMTYLDAPGQPVPLALQAVHTKEQPSPGRRVPRRAKERAGAVTGCIVPGDAHLEVAKTCPEVAFGSRSPARELNQEIS
jgi:hypothetical protein